MGKDFNRRSSKSLEDIWGDEDDFEEYSTEAVNAARQDFVEENSEDEVIEEEKKKIERRSARFNNPQLPSRSHDPEDMDSKWDKFKT